MEFLVPVLVNAVSITKLCVASRGSRLDYCRSGKTGTGVSLHVSDGFRLLPLRYGVHDELNTLMTLILILSSSSPRLPTTRELSNFSRRLCRVRCVSTR